MNKQVKKRINFLIQCNFLKKIFFDDNYIKLIDKLNFRKEEGTLRSLSSFEDYIDFFSNDYLGFSNLNYTHSKIGGSSGSRLISGTSSFVLELEKRHFGALAGQGLVNIQLKNYEKAIESYEKAKELYPSMRSPDIMIKQIKDLIKKQSI